MTWAAGVPPEADLCAKSQRGRAAAEGRSEAAPTGMVVTSSDSLRFPLDYNHPKIRGVADFVESVRFRPATVI